MFNNNGYRTLRDGGDKTIRQDILFFVHIKRFISFYPYHIYVDMNIFLRDDRVAKPAVTTCRFDVFLSQSYFCGFNRKKPVGD